MRQTIHLVSLALFFLFLNGFKKNNALRVDAGVSQALQKIVDDAGGISNISADMAKTDIEDLIKKIRNAISGNPGVNLNDLIF